MYASVKPQQIASILSWDNFRYLGLCVAVTLASTTGTTAYAQDRSVLEEVVVTAQKRSESLQSVPIAITAFSEEELRKSDISNLDDVAIRTPGFSLTSWNKGQPYIFIRGIGSRADGAGSDASVVTFLDEVYIGRTAGGVFDLFNLERIEVLRGPQGTLFGKNATGGAISLFTTKPDEAFVSRFEATAGNFNARTVKALISGPLGDNLFGDVSAVYRKRDGYVESVVTGEDYNDVDTQGIRGSLRYLPTDALELTLRADYNKTRETGNGRGIFSPGSLYDTAAATDPQAVANFRKTFSGELGYQEPDVWGTSLHINWDAFGGQVTSITAYRESDYQAIDDVAAWDNNTLPPSLSSYADIDEQAEQFSQEVRFTSTAFNERMSYVTGLYYFSEDVTRNEDNFLELAAIGLAGTAFSFQDNSTDSYSVFADFTYDITERLSFTGGARYTYEEKKINQAGVPTFHTILEDYDVNDEESWDAVTPRAVLNFQLNPDVFLYASISKGFKSGGYAGTASTAVAAMTPFDQEQAIAYEVGSKAEFLDSRLRLNIAAFYLDYTDLQVLQRRITPDNPIGVLVTENAADAVSQGVEIEFTYLPFDNFQISGSYAYLDATYESYLEPNGNDNSGNALVNSPENTVNINAQYAVDVGASGSLEFRFDYFFRDEMAADSQNLESGLYPSYNRSNVRMTYAPVSQRWEVALWSNNIFDEEYALHSFGADPFAALVIPAPPRTYGVTATLNFGD